MHLHRRHPEVQENSRLALDRQQHALFGVPICRFCHVRACDWSALRKHIEEGHCRWIQAKTAAGHPQSELLAIIEREEAQKPPQPPDDVLDDSALQAARDLLHSSNDKLVQIGPQLRGLARQCLLCAQRVQYSARIKPHWQAQHAGAWQHCQQSAQSESASLVALFVKPCRFCGSQAKNTREHASQCPALFQFLAGRHLQRGGHALPAAAQATFSAPQARKAAAPKQRLLADMFGSSKPSTTSHAATHLETKSAGDVQPPPDVPVIPARRSDANVPMSSEQWILSLVLSNPHNHCYANAGMLALFAALDTTPTYPGALQALKQTAQQAARHGRPLTLCKQFVLRSLLRQWRFGPEQQDTIEFITLLLQAARVAVGRWESRIDSHGSVEVYTRGAGPIALPVQGQAGTLQEAISAWHQQGSLHALCSHPDILLVYLARYVGNGKSFTEITFHDEVQVPVFVQGMQIEWRVYRPVSAVLHFGATPVAGHYRSLLKISGQWFFTQDGVAAKSQNLLRQHRKNVYAIWLQRQARVDPEPLEASGQQ